MVSFELGKEIEIDVFVFSREWNKEKILSSSSIRDACSTPHGDSESFPCPTLVTRREKSFSISLPSSKLILFYSDELTKLIIALYLTARAYFSLVTDYTIRSSVVGDNFYAKEQVFVYVTKKLLFRFQSCSGSGEQ